MFWFSVFVYSLHCHSLLSILDVVLHFVSNGQELGNGVHSKDGRTFRSLIIVISTLELEMVGESLETAGPKYIRIYLDEHHTWTQL